MHLQLGCAGTQRQQGMAAQWECSQAGSSLCAELYQPVCIGLPAKYVTAKYVTRAPLYAAGQATATVALAECCG